PIAGKETRPAGRNPAERRAESSRPTKERKQRAPPSGPLCQKRNEGVTHVPDCILPLPGRPGSAGPPGPGALPGPGGPGGPGDPPGGGPGPAQISPDFIRPAPG